MKPLLLNKKKKIYIYIHTHTHIYMLCYYVHVIVVVTIKDMNEFIEERKMCQDRPVYSKKELY